MNWLDTKALDSYLRLINSGSTPEFNINKKTGVCYGYASLIGGQVHHIIPRSEGGDNDPTNLVDLSYQDHLEAHYLLSKGIQTTSSRVALAYMVRIAPSKAVDVILTPAMKREYALACEIARQKPGKPVAYVRNYRDIGSYRVWLSQTDCAQAVGCTKVGMQKRIRESRKQIEKHGRPMTSSNWLRGIYVDADCDWIKSYLELGHAPQVNPDFRMRRAA